MKTDVVVTRAGWYIEFVKAVWNEAMLFLSIYSSLA